MYWTASNCLASNVLRAACAARVGTWYFVEPPRAIGTTETVSAYTVSASDTAGALIAYGSGGTNGDFLSVQTTFAEYYDMSYYPFESHKLKIRLMSPLTTQSVNLAPVGRYAFTDSETVPSAWTIEKPWECASGERLATEPARGSTTLSYSYIECSIQVSKVDVSWLCNSFILFLTVVLTNCFLSLGHIVQPLSAITGAPPDPRELPLALGQRAGPTVAFALAYIFAIEYKPYGQSLGYYSGGLPISFVTTLGLLFGAPRPQLQRPLDCHRWVRGAR